MNEMEILQQALKAFGGVDEEAFELSHPYWHLQQYNKGEF
jgi:hypothetical protein